MNTKPPDEESRSENTEGIAFPEHLSKIGLPFDDVYALAQQMYDARKAK